MNITTELRVEVHPDDTDKGLDWDISWQEFQLNWVHQAPHHELLSDYGYEFFKDEKRKRT